MFLKIPRARDGGILRNTAKSEPLKSDVARARSRVPHR
jgi:hypothetical protein